MASKIIINDYYFNKKHLYKNELKDSIIEIRNYYLQNKEKAYKIKIIKRNLDILIKNQNYEIQFNVIELSILTKKIFNSIDNAIDYIIKIFEQKRVRIKKIVGNKSFLLLLKVSIYNQEKDMEITLLPNGDYNNLINDEFVYQNIQLNKNIINIKNEFIKIIHL